MNRKSYSNFSRVTIKWLASLQGFSKLPVPLEKLLEKYLKIFISRGTREAIRFCKERRAYLFRFLSLNSLGLKSSHLKGCPKDLRFLTEVEELSVPYIKLLITILSLSRILRTKIEPNLSTIEGPSELRRYPFIEKDFIEFWNTLGYPSSRSPKESLRFKNYHKTSNAGPNGQALWTSLVDLYTIYINYPSLLKDIFILGGKKLEKYILLIIKYFPYLKNCFPIYQGQIRKLICFPDREGKTREVAIFDYYSQASLIPLHKYLFKVLKKIPQDYTFDQTSYMNTIGGSEIYYSIDLTAFTDRFPIRVNEDLLSSRIGPEMAQSWSRIMTQPFTFQNKILSYSVGNPMGAYSSWNSTTLSHHFVIWKACKNKGFNWKTAPYAMLGDDLVIGNHIIAKEYCRLIRTLGVHWSKEKTHVSTHFFEFAKRLHWSGFDVSPFPVPGLWAERNRVIGIAQVLDNALGKGWFSTKDDMIGSLDKYFSLRGFPRRIRTKWISTISKVWHFTAVLQGKVSALELFPFVESLSSMVASKLDESKINNLLVSSVMMSFVDSSSSIIDTKKHKDSLGQVAVEITVYLTSLFDVEGSEDVFSLPESVPHTHVWGVISEDYLKVQKEAYIIDTIKRGEWDPLLRNLKIPTSDKSVYFGRKIDLLYMESSNIVRKFEEFIPQLAAYPQLI